LDCLPPPDFLKKRQEKKEKNGIKEKENIPKKRLLVPKRKKHSHPLHVFNAINCLGNLCSMNYFASFNASNKMQDLERK